MSEEPHPADQARADRVAELKRQREHVAFLAYRHAKEAEHLLDRYEHERDTAEKKRQLVRVLDQEIHHLGHPVPHAHLVNEHYVPVDPDALTELLAGLTRDRPTRGEAK